MQQRQAELEAGYTAVLAAGDAEYGLAALTRLGLVSARLAERVAEAPAPPGLDEDQQALFQGELASRYVLPLEARATAALEKAVAKAGELGLFGPWLEAALDQLEAYRPGSFPPPRLVSWSPLDPGFDAAAAEAKGRAALIREAGVPGAWLELGQAALARGELPLARLRLEMALRLGERSPAAPTALGAAALGAGDPASALAAFARAPDDARALTGQGVVLLGQRAFARAAEVLARAAAREPTSAPVQLALGWAFDAQRTREPAQGERAGEAFSRAVELGLADPGPAICAAGWAFAAAPAGRDRARGWLRRCAELGSTSAQERERLLARLSALEAAAPR
jgi:tetratricopeptide (TPR) repeat protein